MLVLPTGTAVSLPDIARMSNLIRTITAHGAAISDHLDQAKEDPIP